MTINHVGYVFATLAAVVLLAGAANAGSKWQTNLVGVSAEDPTITVKSKVQFKDKGLLQAKVDGLTDGAGALVTTDTSFKQFGASGLNGDEYMVIVEGLFPALGVDFEFNLPVELKKGKGKGKLDASSLFTLIPAGVHRASELRSVKLVGPYGTVIDPITDECVANLTAGGFVILGAANPCDRGDCTFGPALACATNADCPAATNCNVDNCERDVPIKCVTIADCPGDIAPETCQKDTIGVGGVLLK